MGNHSVAGFSLARKGRADHQQREREGESLIPQGLIIAIDGPSGAGKSTAARALAKRLGYLYIDTGAMYRAVAWQVLRAGIALDDTARIGELAARARIELTGNVDTMRVLIDGCDITAEIRTPHVSQAASIVSAIPAVRRALVARQQEMGRAGGIVMEGRDIGTQVFPQAGVKFFLDASVEARSQRRFSEDAARGVAAKSLDATLAEIQERDIRDRTRTDSPLVQAPDAIPLDSSGLTAEQVVERMIEILEAKGRAQETNAARRNSRSAKTKSHSPCSPASSKN
jgi:cytidylate kinase